MWNACTEDLLSVENGRYGHGCDPTGVLVALVSQSLMSLYQAVWENAATCILRNGWHTPSKALHADH